MTPIIVFVALCVQVFAMMDLYRVAHVVSPSRAFRDFGLSFVVLMLLAGMAVTR